MNNEKKKIYGAENLEFGLLPKTYCRIVLQQVEKSYCNVGS